MFQYYGSSSRLSRSGTSSGQASGITAQIGETYNTKSV
jgi:hypothetical protein